MRNAPAGRPPSRYRLSMAVSGAALLIAALSGCGSSSSKAADTTVAPASSPGNASGSAATSSAASGSAASGSAASSTATGAGGDDCGGAVARVTPAIAAFTDVTKVTMVAACGQVSIRTSLPAGVLGSASSATGIKICKAAATVAYQGDVSSITVDSVDGHELAIGLKGADCLP